MPGVSEGPVIRDTIELNIGLHQSRPVYDFIWEVNRDNFPESIVISLDTMI